MADVKKTAEEKIQYDPQYILQVKDLKKYFPIKGGMLNKTVGYVKAVDGVTFNLKRGTTMGLVGESGCGKSTLGRTLLQLYRQTDGRTMYYGKTLDDIAPEYMLDTIRTLSKRRTQLRALEARRDAIQKEYDALADGRAKYNMANALQSAKKQARDAFLDIVNLVGGFMMLDDLTPVTAVFMNLYKLSKLMCKAEEKRDDRKLTYDDAKFAYEDAVSEGRNARSLKAKADKARALLDAEEDRIAQLHTQLESARAQIEEMRKPYKDNEEFQRLEGFRDDGIDLARLKYNEIRKLRSDLQMIFQDPYSSLNPRMTVGQIIGEGMLAHKFFKRNDKRMQAEILKVMDDAGLAPYFLHRYPHQFSGGQRQRIGIARSLAVHPKFVVCDEAVSALDVSIQSQIINLLKDLKEQQNLTYMFITHDLSVVKYISDRIGVMYLGTLVELAPAQEIFDNPKHPYTEALMQAIPTTDLDTSREMKILEGDIPSPVNPPKGCKFHTRCRYCTEICEHAVPAWQEVGPNHFVACHHMLGCSEETQNDHLSEEV